MQYAIEVSRLTKKFGDFVSVDEVSFSIPQGEIFGFLGANGAGKSTTIKMLCGLLEPTSGDALVGGYSIMNEPEKVKENIGYMSQKFSLYNDLSVEENINFFGGVYGLERSELAERKKWALEVSFLQGREKTVTGSLPGGIKQRLALATAVIHKPKIVFLDEPTSGVDPISRRAFWELINSLSEEGITVFVTTHYLEEAEYCANIILINAGKIIAEGTPTELKQDHIKSRVLEISSNNSVELMNKISESHLNGEISIFGDKIHFIPADNAASNVETIRFLNTNFSNFDMNISEILPSLEDVFIHLIEKKY
ncbi:MAG: ATP-binding cassette domain-containing protein [Ignavibacteria bacterium]|nr:ATP-binding cassette domain-containing protein [Ignavibacteria bacterium]